MDLGNPVLKPCQNGMRAEAEGRLPEARALFERAAEHDAALPAGEYGEQLRAAVTDGLRRSS
ncbi:hypothetical protein Acy02nite_76010 [Actinoplanes cyaneus]|uniref:Uncharacterized protein n=1 Tax=Actinoplanes cyaneus TaxID=52696 RepID=A0A919IPB2_9ACTN|nr:hypothetical protein [Actinoplanes cyaneus]GID69720.1 hypothetical protein Acy02nite_76010 [Actinoplanes cyaneus]